MRSRTAWLILLLFLLPLAVSLAAWAETGAPAPPTDLDARRLKWGFAGFGLLFGFFLSYSIRSGSKTQDVFKSLTGVIGAGGVTASATLIPGEAHRIIALGAYTLGAIAGFVAYVIIAVILATLFAHAGNETWRRWAEVLGRVILGEEFSPPPRPGAAIAPKPSP